MGIIETIKMLAREEGIEIGIKRAAEQLDRKYVTNLLCDGSCTITDIARYVDVTEAFVQEVKSSLITPTA